MQSHHNDAVSHLDEALRGFLLHILLEPCAASVFNVAKEARLRLDSVLVVEHISH